MVISVCVGSSCHLKGAYEVITILQGIIERTGHEKDITLKGEFCLGRCSEGVTVVIDGEIVCGVSPDEVPGIYMEKILPRLEEKRHVCDKHQRG
ncbi:MAG TPA: (2Fe-2S) ferredoxin domain-containing protein [Clostridia bacterium]|nr:(2Fe-2S) ferredoxin domain-containing protein [Clostridia bacterium]